MVIDHVKHSGRTLTHAFIFSIDKSKALSLVLHCADISHPAKSWRLHLPWTENLLEEFFRQVTPSETSQILISKKVSSGIFTDRILHRYCYLFQGDHEAELGLPYSPLCDRKNTLVAESQIG